MALLSAMKLMLPSMKATMKSVASSISIRWVMREWRYFISM